MKANNVKRSKRGGASSPKKPKVRSAPVAKARPVASRQNPKIQTSAKKATVCHSEYFYTLQPESSGYTVQSFTCNPGQQTMFPWLAAIAQSYETYKFKTLEFIYHPATGTVLPGQVGMVFDFDTNDEAPSDYLTAMQYYDKAASTVWDEFHLRPDLLQGDKLPSRYTRPGSVTNEDMKTFDVGRLHLFSVGVSLDTPQDGLLGYIEVKYVVDLFTPQPRRLIGGDFAATIATPTNLVSNLKADSQAIPFFHVDTAHPSRLVFDQPWQGLVNTKLVGKDLLQNSMMLGGNVQQFTHGETRSLVDAVEGIYNIVNAFDVKTGRGQYIEPVIGTSGVNAGVLSTLFTFATMAFPKHTFT